MVLAPGVDWTRVAAESPLRVTTTTSLTFREMVVALDPSLPTNRLTIVGDTIRVRSDRVLAVVARPGRHFVGHVTSVDGRSLTLELRDAAAHDPVSIPLQGIACLERRAGEGSRFRHLGQGTLIGAALGAVIAAGSEDCSDGGILCSTALAAVGGSLAGAMTGALVSVLLPPDDRWVLLGAPVGGIPTDGPLTDASAKPRTFKGWTVAGGIGIPHSGPGADFEGAMRAAGLDATVRGFFGTITYPISTGSVEGVGFPKYVRAGVELGPGWGVGLRWQETPIGHTAGEREQLAVGVAYRVRTAAVVVTMRRSGWHASVGPAWHRIGLRDDSATSPSRQEWDTWAWRSRVGWMAGAGLNLPTKTRVFLDLDVHYVGAGPVTAGPLQSRFSFWPGEFPAVPVGFGHWLISIGPGIRF